MRSLRLFVVGSLLLLSMSLVGQDRSAIWTKMYERSGTLQIKYSVMQNIANIDDEGIIPLLEKILVQDIVAELDNKRSVNEESAFVGLSKIVIKKLGELKAIDSAEYVFQVYLNHQDALLQSECLIALGNMRATDYVDDIVRILHLKNQRPVEGTNSSDDIDDENRVAYAAITALDRFKHIDGYSTVFFASLGWYNQRVRGFADKVLLTITENPVDALIPLIEDGDLNSKKKATYQINESSAPAADKIRAARIALQQGHNNVPNNIREGVILTSIRKRAMETTWENNSNDILDIPYLKKSLLDGVDLEEKILAIKTLAKNDSDEALEVLTSTLIEFNDRNAYGFGISYLEEDVIRELIDTLGDSGKRSSEFALTSVLYSGYPDGIQRKAKKALEQLN